jgi:hypothetical protein
VEPERRRLSPAPSGGGRSPSTILTRASLSSRRTLVRSCRSPIWSATVLTVVTVACSLTVSPLRPARPATSRRHDSPHFPPSAGAGPRPIACFRARRNRETERNRHGGNYDHDDQ